MRFDAVITILTRCLDGLLKLHKVRCFCREVLEASNGLQLKVRLGIARRHLGLLQAILQVPVDDWEDPMVAIVRGGVFQG